MKVSEKFLFGPVASRRLGRSLGVDLVPYKTCPFDCLYCEVGRTTRKSCARERFFEPEELLAEVERFFAQGGEADYITITGSGEPTLSADVGFIIEECKRRFAVPVAIITNGALMGDPAVRRELMLADLVMPSLDSALPESFAALNRPADGVSLDDIIAGLEAFAREYKGRLWLEVLFAEGVNDGEDDVEALAAFIARARPDRVQINTVVRPPADASAAAVSRQRLEEIAMRFSREAPVEIIAPAVLSASGRPPEDPRRAVLETLRRRPCTAEDLRGGLSIPRDDVEGIVEELIAGGLVRSVRHDRADFYEAVESQ